MRFIIEIKCYESTGISEKEFDSDHSDVIPVDTSNWNIPDES